MRNALLPLGIGALVGALLVWLGVSVWLNGQRATLTHWQDSTGAAFRLEADLIDRQRLAALQRAESSDQASRADKAQADQERAARQVADRLSIRLRASLASATTGVDSVVALVPLVAAQDSQIVHLEAETVSLRNALRSEVARSVALVELVAVGDSGIAIRDRRIASQDSVIRSRLVPSVSRESKWLGFLPLPSRTVTFVLGLAVGIAANR